MIKNCLRCDTELKKVKPSYAKRRKYCSYSCSMVSKMSELKSSTKELMLSKKWGNRTILEELRTDYYKVQCDCGRIGKLRGATLRMGIALMCGKCAKNDTHGLSSHPLYRGWSAMKQRCINPSNSSYRIYGARGIKVCDRWQKFENFLEDMGERPKGLQLDRIDIDGNYEPSNCRWVTPLDNANNRRISVINNDKYTMVKISDLCKECTTKVRHKE